MWNWRHWCVGVEIFLNTNHSKIKETVHLWLTNIYLHFNPHNVANFHIQRGFTFLPKCFSLNVFHCAISSTENMRTVFAGKSWVTPNRFKRSMWLPQASDRYYWVNTSANCVSLLLVLIAAVLWTLSLFCSPHSLIIPPAESLIFLPIWQKDNVELPPKLLYEELWNVSMYEMQQLFEIESWD